MQKILRLSAITCLALVVATPASAERTCPNGKSKNGAMWMSILHPGLGEYFLNDFGSWRENMPPRKFWLGFIPGFGWPGYLQAKSAKDARQCKTGDGIAWNEND